MSAKLAAVSPTCPLTLSLHVPVWSLQLAEPIGIALALGLDYVQVGIYCGNLGDIGSVPIGRCGNHSHNLQLKIRVSGEELVPVAVVFHAGVVAKGDVGGTGYRG
ncbi:hypothetical protein BU25DRAFT_444479 [Macroventuria anomochaeta]|uniref:Uncharacterized protein n=1 Tax=Macroventuria anomochaeta TaxID=301207 RepID=A0ACB6SIF7_9PLEO|nr:uncharacterized protein BU25DRAFT_444479 [Macroventuria anomochaeta]KAF2633844.1 hypothetical protein BU25DRAFT_444479 [Macroventuria anomochaeta]